MMVPIVSMKDPFIVASSPQGLHQGGTEQAVNA